MVGAHHQINNVFTMDSYFQLELTIENSQLCRYINEKICFFILQAKSYNKYFLQDTLFVLKD